MTNPTGYRIGKVSKLTGISPDTLRIWERRYASVVPMRTEAGGRLYSADDIARLKLMKNLVEGGDSIGNIASLSIENLQARVDEAQQTSAQQLRQRPVRVVTVGEGLSVMLENAESTPDDLELVASYLDLRAFQSETGDLQAELLLIEQPTLHAETALRILDWLKQINAEHAVVIYRFASGEALEKMPGSRTSTLKAPVNLQTIHDHIVALYGKRWFDAGQPPGIHDAMADPAPARKYSDEALAKISSISPVIQCECPHHLADLIASLSAFEQYSSECESRNLEDAELHAHLSKTASHARHMIENALDMVVELENIEL